MADDREKEKGREGKMQSFSEMKENGREGTMNRLWLTGDGTTEALTDRGKNVIYWRVKMVIDTQKGGTDVMGFWKVHKSN